MWIVCGRGCRADVAGEDAYNRPGRGRVALVRVVQERLHDDFTRQSFRPTNDCSLVPTWINS